MKRKPTWDAKRVRALRQHLGLTQQELALEMGARQQTISEWETGLYQPRGLSERLLSLVAEQAGFVYGEVQEASPLPRRVNPLEGRGPTSISGKPNACGIGRGEGSGAPPGDPLFPQ